MQEEKTILDAHGLWESIEPQAGVALDEKKSKSARTFIFHSILEDVLLLVSKNKTVKEVWESLKTRYLGAERVQKARLHTLKSEFESLRMKEGESIDEFLGKLSGLISKYNSLGATLEDNQLVRKLLGSVPDKYLQLATSMEQYSDIDKMPFEEAFGKLKAYEDRLKFRSGNSSTESSLLLTKIDTSNQKNLKVNTNLGGRGCGSTSYDRGGRGRGRGRGRSGRGGYNSQRDGGNNYQKPKDKKHIKCFNFENYGHYASECKTHKEKNDEANLTTTHDDEHALLLSICGDEIQPMVLLNEEKVFPSKYETGSGLVESMWYLDNGVSKTLFNGDGRDRG
ncbi:uncharacterized protein [Rutidosis leptorrhynchoides]|uniref:uncharacterized protein n=1 Tax=Rutidosis leptorrhynchoides TaxID=125765 RepID=UPI003A99035F